MKIQGNRLSGERKKPETKCTKYSVVWLERYRQSGPARREKVFNSADLRSVYVAGTLRKNGNVIKILAYYKIVDGRCVEGQQV